MDTYTMEIQTAARTGDLEFFINLPIYMNLNIEIEGLHTTTPLILAASEGHETLVRYLIYRGVNINKFVELRDNKRMTALLASIVTGQCEITRILLEFGAQVEIPGVRYNLWDGIIFCDDCPCEQLFRIFVEQGVDLHIVNEYAGTNVLTSLCSKGMDTLVNKMIDCWEVDINQEIKNWASKTISKNLLFDTIVNGKYALFQALVLGRIMKDQVLLRDELNFNSPSILSLLQLLIQCCGCDLEYVLSMDSCTILGNAVKCGNFEVVHELLAIGQASINAIDQFGNTPLDYASDPAIIELLLANGGRKSCELLYIEPEREV